MLLSIIMLLLCAAFGGAAFFYLKYGKKKSKEVENAAITTANEFVNVRDIKGSLLYTRDGLALCFLKVSPISIDLFSKNEKKNLMKMLTAEMSGTQFPFQFLAVSRPIDIAPLISELSALLITDNRKQKEILRKEISEMNTLAISGEIVERQFYIMLWDKADEDVQRDLVNKAKHFASNFTECGIGCEVLLQHEIVRLCNLVNNPAYTHLENCDMDASIPVIPEAKEARHGD